MTTFDYCVKFSHFDVPQWTKAVAYCQELISSRQCRIYSSRTSVSEGYQREYCFEFQHGRHALKFM